MAYAVLLVNQRLTIISSCSAPSGDADPFLVNIDACLSKDCKIEGNILLCSDLNADLNFQCLFGDNLYKFIKSCNIYPSSLLPI